MFLAGHDHRIGPGHFGRVLDYDTAEDGAERFSVHYEADIIRGARSVLDIRPLLWSTDGWPVAGDNLAEGTYQIVSRQSEYTLEEHVPGAPAPATGAAPRVDPSFPAAAKEPAGPSSLRVTRYLTLDNQTWKISPVAGGFYKIVNASTGDAIGMADGGSVALAAYTGADGQFWKLDEFPDGGYRIRNKASGQSLTASQAGGVALTPFFHSYLCLWTITTP